MRTNGTRLASAAIAACACCTTLAVAQQRPAYLGGPQPAAQAPSQAPQRAPGEPPGAIATSADDVIRKQTSAIVELAERVNALEKRVAELEAKGKK